MTTENTALKTIHSLAAREIEIRQAARLFPGIEIGAAYKKWKEAKDETADMLISSAPGALKKEISSALSKLKERPCTRPGCAGTQFLESVCAGCIEGQAGYQSKWTCRTCLHRDLSKESLYQWMKNLSSA
jgi:hypothetical protein